MPVSDIQKGQTYKTSDGHYYESLEKAMDAQFKIDVYPRLLSLRRTLDRSDHGDIVDFIMSNLNELRAILDQEPSGKKSP